MNITVDDLKKLDHVAIYNFETMDVKTINGVSTDSRSIQAGEVFFAIRGEKFDGHNYISDAYSRGSVCAVVDKKADSTVYKNKPSVVVDDTTKAYGKLANVYRRKFKIPIIAVGGSNGKTTTKEMIASVLNEKYSVLHTEGNLNNQIGVPKTIFELQPHHEVAVIEIGTNHFGELKYLCEILEPTHGLITNVGKEHLEFFKTLNGVARAEGELANHLARTGTGFVNLDDDNVVERWKSQRKKVTYGFKKSHCTVKGKFLSVDENGCIKFTVRTNQKKEFGVQLSVPGKHAMYNGLAASAVGLCFGVSSKKIQHALYNFSAIDKRMEKISVGNVTILNDTYNANPDSVISALETIQAMKCKGKKIIILSDMLELGALAKKEHERIGKIIADMGFEYLLTFGQNAKSIFEKADTKMKVHYDQKNILAEYASELISEKDIVLVKGSRGMKMEDVITFLVERLKQKIG